MSKNGRNRNVEFSLQIGVLGGIFEHHDHVNVGGRRQDRFIGRFLSMVVHGCQGFNLRSLSLMRIMTRILRFGIVEVCCGNMVIGRLRFQRLRWGVRSARKLGSNGVTLVNEINDDAKGNGEKENVF